MDSMADALLQVLRSRIGDNAALAREVENRVQGPSPSNVQPTTPTP